MIMIAGFDHTSFTVPDVTRSVRFWSEALGFEVAEVVERDGEWPARVTGVPGARLKIAHLFGYGHHMEFIQYLADRGGHPPWQPNSDGAAHVALAVEDIHDTCKELLKHGATRQGEVFEVTIDTVVCGWSIYIRDPNGILIELWEPAQDPQRK